MSRTIPRELHNGMDLIDSRDVIARIGYLMSEREAVKDAIEMMGDTATSENMTPEDWDESEEGEELKALLALTNEAESVGDWIYGATLIRDDYFEEYAQEMAVDMGAIQPQAPWPTNHIDWDAACDELKQDYRSVPFGDEVYWVRG